MHLPFEAEEFLKKLEFELRTLDRSERDDIIHELRAHLIERQAQGKHDVLQGFESPTILASGFLKEATLREIPRRPLRILRYVTRALSYSAKSIVVSLPPALLQITALGFIVTAIMKPLNPEQVGFWIGHGNFYAGLNSGDPALREILGWWGIPVFVAVATILLWASMRLTQRLRNWSNRLHIT